MSGPVQMCFSGPLLVSPLMKVTHSYALWHTMYTHTYIHAYIHTYIHVPTMYIKYILQSSVCVHTQLHFMQCRIQKHFNWTYCMLVVKVSVPGRNHLTVKGPPPPVCVCVLVCILLVHYAFHSQTHTCTFNGRKSRIKTISHGKLLLL